MYMSKRLNQRAEASTASSNERKEPSSPDKVVAAITDGVLRRRYVPGQRLIEADLTHEFKVSRGTIREALKKLAAEGVVTLAPHRGAYVRSMTRAAAYELLTVLEYLTSLMARLAAERIHEGDNRKRFQRALASLLAHRTGGHHDDFVEERRRFYRTLLDIGGNSELARVMPLTHIHLFRMQFHLLMSPRDLADQFSEYEQIGKAILSGDAAATERFMRQHIRRTRKRIDRLPNEAFFSDD
jgi:DNA-binding GntR family transcriptional regulator